MSLHFHERSAEHSMWRRRCLLVFRLDPEELHSVSTLESYGAPDDTESVYGTMQPAPHWML